MADSYPRFISSAWVLNPIGGVRPDRLQHKLEARFQDALPKEGSGFLYIAPEQAAFWRQGHRMVEAMSWTCAKSLGKIRSPGPRNPCVQGSWVWRKEGGAIVPENGNSGLPWPAMQDLVADYPEVLSGPASQVALSQWKGEFESVESSPSWVYWALQADKQMLRTELEQCAWSEQDIAHWWRLMEGLLAPTAQHWEVDVLDGKVSTRKLPISGTSIPGVIHLLAAFLPPHARRPARFSSLAKPPHKGGSSPLHEAVSSALRGWVSPARFWSLRRSLHWNDLRESAHSVHLWDFEKLPRPVAHRALDKFAETLRLAPPPHGTRLPQLPRLLEAAPNWSGWVSVLETLESLDALTSQGLGALSGLREKQMNAQLSQAPSAPPRRPASRF